MAGVSEKDLKDEHDAFDKNVLKSFTKKKAINTRYSGITDNVINHFL
jgi:hypothetical protein